MESESKVYNFVQLEHMEEKADDSSYIIYCSEDLAHMLYAASDILLVPSMFEPCGLTQMIGMRYGSVRLNPPSYVLICTMQSIQISVNEFGLIPQFKS